MDRTRYSASLNASGGSMEPYRLRAVLQEPSDETDGRYLAEIPDLSGCRVGLYRGTGAGKSSQHCDSVHRTLPRPGRPPSAQGHSGRRRRQSTQGVQCDHGHRLSWKSSGVPHSGIPECSESSSLRRPTAKALMISMVKLPPLSEIQPITLRHRPSSRTASIKSCP